ncbi:hypothetical protein [Aneurinibacillus terranovensis]|uniref:hypothetical protein n=1 Tax=Aneurinibacillus terranovensis TaxID=278991 RepID=UPI0004250EB2|nr:hypothetical protein [Aneurinibacillus terranovensis]
MARYMIETVEDGYQVVKITGANERWEDIMESLRSEDKVYPIISSLRARTKARKRDAYGTKY